jgi:hypothetical protein
MCPFRIASLINPFLHKQLIVGGSQGVKHAQVLDIHNALITIRKEGQAKGIQDKGFRVYSWEERDPLADLFLIRLGAYPSNAEIGIDYKAMVSDVLSPAEVALAPDVPIPAETLEHPTISYLSRHLLRRHYSIDSGWNDPGFYVGDVADFDDLVTYWNLRAADIPLTFVDQHHLARFVDLIPSWEKIALELLSRAPEYRRRVAVWSRVNDPKIALQLLGGRPVTFCVITDHSWHGGAVVAPMMYFGDAHVLGTVSRSATQARVSFQLGDKPFADDLWFHTQHLVASLDFGIGLYGDENFTLRLPLCTRAERVPI